MRYDSVIIGGGLSGLTCGIALSKAGCRVAVVAGGQSTLHFNPGSLELLATPQAGSPDVERPIEALDALPEGHPYRLLGDSDRVMALAAEARQLLADAGLPTQGNANTNHCRITPIGVLKPAWLTLQGIATAGSPGTLPWTKVTLLDLKGYVDFATDFVADGLRHAGAEVDVRSITVDALQAARRSATEMRATSIAKVLEGKAALRQLAEQVREVVTPGATAFIPAVFGLENDDAFRRLREMSGIELLQLPTMPPSAPGTRMATLLRHYFRMLGGTYLLGDNATAATFDGDTLNAVVTAKLGSDMPLRANNFVLATGSFVSRGLVADYRHIYEPLMNLDVAAPNDRSGWSRYGVMSHQPYQNCGVTVDSAFHPSRRQQAIGNLYAIGQVLAGADPIALGCNGGVSMLTALAAAHHIIGH